MADWSTLAGVVRNKVSRGEVTTYSDLTAKLFQNPDVPKHHPVTAMLKKWESMEPTTHLSHRVVRDDGTLALPGQEQRLRAEGVPFKGAGVVDIATCRAKL